MPNITFGFENYCSPTGNDSTGDGSITLPYLTLGKCLTELASFSQSVTKPYQYFILRTWMRAGTYTEAIISASQPFPGDPDSIVTQFEAVGIFAYQGETVTIRPASGTNVINLTVNNGGFVQGPSCFVEFKNLIIDAVNVTGSAVVFDGLCHHNLLYGCTVQNSDLATVSLVAGTHDNTIKLNDINANTLSGITDAGDDNIIQDNLVHANADGIVLSGVGVCERNRVYSNSDDGIVSTVAAVVRNNLCYGNSGDGIQASAGKIYGNTCDGNTALGINASGTADPQNNTCFNNGTDAIGSGSGNLDDGSDPLFVDEAGFNFHIQSGSPAIDIGNTLVDLPADFDLRLRPAGVAFDAGAYEFQPPGTVAAITITDTHFALGVGHACTSPMDYRMVQAVPKAITGTPKAGIALCVDPASTSASFTGYVLLIDTTEGHGISDNPVRVMKYVAQPLTGLGTVLTDSNFLAAYSTLVGEKFSLMVGTNTINANNNIMGNIYEGTNLFSNDAAISRSNFAFGVVGIGTTVSITQSGDDLIIDTDGSTFTFTNLQAGCMESGTNIAAFEETFTFNTPVSYNKTTGTYNGWSNFGIQTPMDCDVLCHCDGNDCYGAFWNACYNYGEIDPQGGDGAGDGMEIELYYNGIVDGTPCTGVNMYLHSGFINGPGTLYGVIVDERDQLIKIVRWEDQTLQTLGTVLVTAPMPSATFSMLIWIINSGSIRGAGDPAEWFVWTDTTSTSTYGAELIDDYLDFTPFGQIAESPNEIMKWKNTHAGLTAVGTQSGNPRDVANWNGFMSMDQLL